MTFSIIFTLIVIGAPFLLKSFFKTPNSLANFSTSLGVLFTFFGVAVGLFNFQPDNIQASIPILLDGLQTAFWTSIAGMLMSMLIKAIPNKFGYNTNEISPSGATLDTLAHYLKEISQNQKNSTDALMQTLGSDGDYSVISQIKNIRLENRDSLSALKKSFDEFSKQMVENSTKSVISALESVMRDFNSKINEQFGENFKELNNAVKLMVEWQKEYREQVELSTQLYKDSSKGINEVKDNLLTISTNNEVMHQTATSLNQMVEKMYGGLDGISKMGEEAKEVLPKINSNIETLTTSFSDQVKAAIDEIQIQANKLNEVQDRINEGTMNRIDQVNKSIEKQFNELDQALSEELSKALETLGNQLSSLSDHFVKDYIPLTDKLRRVVKIAEGIESKN